jgi:hypothetical protein
MSEMGYQKIGERAGRLATTAVTSWCLKRHEVQISHCVNTLNGAEGGGSTFLEAQG